MPSLTLDEVEVTANRAQVQSEAFRLVAQVSREEIQSRSTANVADILAYLPGVDIRSRGASQVQSDVSLRGGTFDQVLILLNGVPVSDCQTGHYSLNLPVSTALIERIEVLQGTAANLTGAFSGAINIITRDAGEDSYTLMLSAGTNGELNPVFAGGWQRSETHINTSVEYARSNGYYAPGANDKEQKALDNSDYQVLNAYLQTRWRGLDVQAGVQWKDAGLGMGYGFGSQDQFDATRTGLLSIRYEQTVGNHWSLSTQAAYRVQHDRYEWHRGTPLNRHWTHNTQAALRAHYASRIGRTSIGAEIKDEYIRSTNMGTHNRLQATLSGEQQFVWRGLAASIGIAGHYNTLIGWHVSGVANIGYSFLRTGSIYVAVSRSPRTPTWTDMYYNAGNQLGCDTLQSEKAWLLSVGGQYTWQWGQAGRLHIAADAYYRWGEDIIDWTYTPIDALRPYHATNQQLVDAAGVELTADYHYDNWLRHITVRYAYTHLSLDLKEAQSRYLDYLRHKLVVSIDHGLYVWPKGSIGACWTLRWQQRLGQYNNSDGVVCDYTPTLLLDGNLYAELPHARIALSCENMTNRHYYDYGGILMPGVCGKLTITANF